MQIRQERIDGPRITTLPEKPGGVTTHRPILAVKLLNQSLNGNIYLRHPWSSSEGINSPPGNYMWEGWNRNSTFDTELRVQEFDNFLMHKKALSTSGREGE